MYRKELFILSAIAFTIFAAVAGVSLMTQRALQHSAEMLAIDTLPGLVNAGAAIDRMNDNWQSMHLLTELPDPASRTQLIKKIELNSTTEFWQRYGTSVFDLRDEQLLQRTMLSRTNYRVLVFQFFKQVNEEHLDDARTFLRTQLEPAFFQYKSNAFNLFELNVETGQRHADRIIRLNRWLPFLVGFFCLLVFLLGVFVGLKGAFGSLVFASRAEDSRARSKEH